MAKRMIDTELWNDEDIIENFTAEDKYFWLYLLTSPHNSICGVMKNSPSLMARDMGLHKDTIVNLIYRFENIHKLIATDKDTSELVILNWGKYNWTKSQDLAKTIEKQARTIQSDKIREIVNQKFVQKLETVLRPSLDGTNTITNNIYNLDTREVTTNTISNDTDSKVTHSISNNRENTELTELVTVDKVDEWFEIVYSLYPRKVSKVQAKRTFEKKLIELPLKDAQQKVKALKHMLDVQCEVWQKENDGAGRKIDYIPHFSTWLNANVEDSKKSKGTRR